MRTKYGIYLFFTFIIFQSCIKDGSEDIPQVINYVEVNDEVPSFSITDEKGNTFNSTDFEGKRSLLIFFETTCSDCRTVLPIINNDIWEKIKTDPDFLLIAVSRGENQQIVNKYWENNNFSMPKYIDTERKVFSLFANNTIPRIYMIDENKIIRWMAIENLDNEPEDIIRLLQGKK